ncbi:MAG TPA: hypothetical protein VNH82_01090 [Candidatus Dormibacteraeota bacterium]|nr:hypothetical protein [Candidatus Dormibacteraeota bacterium]
MPLARSLLLATVGQGDGLGIGIVILAVGLLIAAGAGLSLRSIWGRARAAAPLPRQGPLPEEGRPLRSPGVGELAGWFRVLVSFDFGCLALLALVLIFAGLAVVFRSL